MQLSRTVKDLTNKTSENMAELKEFIIEFYLIVLTGGNHQNRTGFWWGSDK
jgi:hypothetical protein